MKIYLSLNKNKHIIQAVTFIFLILICIPQNEVYAFMDPLLRLFRYIGLLWALLLFFTARIYSEHKLWPLFVFIFWIVVSSAFNEVNAIDAVKLVYPIFTCSILVQYYIRCKGKKGLSSMAVLYAVIMIIQVFSALTHCFGEIYSGAWQGNYFLGIRVNISFILPYAMGLNLINSKIEKRSGRIFLYLTFISGVYFSIYEEVSTAIVTIAVLMLSLLVLDSYRYDRRFLKFVLILVIIFSAGFAFIGLKTDLFTWFFVNVLNEDATLDGRTILWEQVFDYLKGTHWIYGYGYKHNFKFTISWWFKGDHPHNEYLEMLFCYGIIGLVLYINMYMVQIRQILKNNYKKIVNIALSTMISSIAMHISSHNYMSIYPYICFVIFMNINQLVVNSDKD